MATFRMQVTAILDAEPSRGKDHVAIAQEVGCSKQTALRYCQEYRTAAHRLAEPVDEHIGWENPEKQALCGFLLSAVQDWKAGKPCGHPQCGRDGHHCAASAANFLRSPLGRLMMDMVDLNSMLVLKTLGIPLEGDEYNELADTF